MSGKYLSEADLINLDLYEYHGGEYTFVDNILNPFWLKVAYMFPEWFAPNLITLSGLLINVFATIVVCYFDPELLGVAPAWVYILAGICIQIYAVFDAADGKQARRLKASSPLGQIFDHGCDAVNLIFIIVTCCSCFGMGRGRMTAALVVSMCSIFVIAQVIEYKTNVLLAGGKYFGVTEAMILMTVGCFITAVKGTGIWDIEVFGVALKHIGSMMMIIGVGSICIGYLVKSFVEPTPIPEDKRGNKNLDNKSHAQRCIPPM